MDKMEQIKSCIADEMSRFEVAFEQTLTTRVPLADNVIHYFLDRRGKQLRPVVALLAAKMAGGEVTEASIQGAVALELLHNASLMHDDVIDKSDERRGMSSINKVWDNRVAVLMGDFFFSKCLVSSNSTGSLAISNVLSDMVIRLTEGELEQLSNVRSHLLSESAYFSVIGGKTASLFSACMKVGALSVGCSEAQVEQLGQIGELMGLVFQIRDDIFDYYPSSEVGKPTGHDILEGKVTLPLLYALQHGAEEETAELLAMLDQNRELAPEQVERLVEYAKAVGGIEYAQAKMKNLAFEAKKLLDLYPKTPARDALKALIDYFIARNH